MKQNFFFYQVYLKGSPGTSQSFPSSLQVILAAQSVNKQQTVQNTHLVEHLSTYSNLTEKINIYFPFTFKLTVTAYMAQNDRAYWLNDAPTGLTFNNCTLCSRCIYVFCIYLRTNSDLCHLHHKLIGFYNRDENCLQHGTDWGL